MAHSYESEYPPGAAVAPGIVQFFRDFYALSDTPGDTPGAHERYVDAFTPDATFILASKTSVGSEEIKATREAMWAKVASRKHTPTKVFPFGQNAEEVMLYGTVAFTFKAGGGAEVDWAGRAQLEKAADGKYRLKFYQVYL
ncbi:hypothetical protein F5X68DRAFT_119803, partial [Plectosphaerella plurivora]